MGVGPWRELGRGRVAADPTEAGCSPAPRCSHGRHGSGQRATMPEPRRKRGARLSRRSGGRAARSTPQAARAAAASQTASCAVTGRRQGRVRPTGVGMRVVGSNRTAGQSVVGSTRGRAPLLSVRAARRAERSARAHVPDGKHHKAQRAADRLFRILGVQPLLG